MFAVVQKKRRRRSGRYYKLPVCIGWLFGFGIMNGETKCSYDGLISSRERLNRFQSDLARTFPSGTTQTKLVFGHRAR